MVKETNSQVNDALLSLKNYIKELVNRIFKSSHISNT